MIANQIGTWKVGDKAFEFRGTNPTSGISQPNQLSSERNSQKNVIAGSRNKNGSAKKRGCPKW